MEARRILNCTRSPENEYHRVVGVCFDIEAKDNSIAILGFSAGTYKRDGFVQLYTKAGSCVGSEGRPSQWTGIWSGRAHGQKSSNVVLESGVDMAPQGTRGFYFHGGNAGICLALPDESSENDDLRITRGSLSDNGTAFHLSASDPIAHTMYSHAGQVWYTMATIDKLLRQYSVLLLKALAGLVRLCLEDVLNFLVLSRVLVKYWNDFGPGMRAFTIMSLAAGILCSGAGPLKDLWGVRKVCMNTPTALLVPFPFELHKVALFSVVVGAFVLQALPGLVFLIRKKYLAAAVRFNEFNFLLGMLECEASD
mmetsp:Transcript_25530/g.48853  ORF Transcript_25530/g.48853 Transcript_25530/m.48853 type:complete len:309 (-) Transcript_25530:10-936(-)